MTDNPVSSSERPLGDPRTLHLRMREGQPGAWAEFVRLYSPLVIQWCQRNNIPRADHPDVGQEVFLAVAQHIGTFEPDEDGRGFRSWVRTITYRKCADYWRQHRGDSPMPLPPEMFDALGRTSDADRSYSVPPDSNEVGPLFRRAIERVRAGCTEQTWTAFWRVVVDGLTPRAAAEELGVTVNVVYLARARVVRQLRATLTDIQNL